MRYDKNRVEELATRFIARNNDTFVFRQLLIELEKMINKQLRDNYKSMTKHWEDMRGDVLAKIWKNRKTLKKTSTKTFFRHYELRIRTHLSRAKDKIQKIKEDFEYKSRVTIDNVQNRRAPGFVDDDDIDELDKRTKDERLNDEAGKKTGESTLKKRLAGQKFRQEEFFAKKAIRREERNPILKICTECQLQCKQHGVRGKLDFQCEAFLPFDESKQGMRGEMTQQSKESSATKKKPRTHITPSQHRVSMPWKKNKDKNKDGKDEEESEESKVLRYLLS